jgi:uncharacterized membrane protein
MVSWGYAFKRGLIIWLWTILWGIVGGIIALIISGGSLFAIVANPSDSSTWAGAMIGVFAGVLIGSLIASIGSFATIVKIVLESAEEKQKPPPP